MMNEQINNKLRQLYELETFQVKYFFSQLSSTDDSIFYKALCKIIVRENKHIDFFTQHFIEENIDIPKIAASIANIAGSLVGESMELTGHVHISKVGVTLEKKTLNIYYDLIKERGLTLKLRDKLIDFQLDNEFHALWLQHFAQYLHQEKSKQNDLIDNCFEEHPTVNLNMRLL